MNWMVKVMRWITSHSRTSKRRGFTLMETGLATIIIGVGVSALVQLLAKGTISNLDGADLTTAVNLANSIHELTYGLSFADPVTPTHWGPETGETLATYNDVDDFDGQVFSPPIDARRQSLPNFTNWSQAVTVQKVDVNRLSTVVPNATVMPTLRVTVTVKHLGQTVYAETWLITQGQ